MTTSARVVLWGTPIGTVSISENTPSVNFEYDREFLESGIQLSPINMPLSNRIYTFPALRFETFHGLPGLLADSLPDRFGNAVINAWLESNGRPRDSMNAVERLCYVGKRGMGALEYIPAIGPSPDATEALKLDELTKLASDILVSREKIKFDESSQAMRQMIRVGTSAGGARAKALIAWNEEEGIVRSGQVDAGEGYGYWILKFDGVEGNRDHDDSDGPQYTRIEYAYYLMASAAGIDMSECRLYSEGTRTHFLTRRFDRDIEIGSKIHMQTLGAMAHVDFNSPGAFSYEAASQVMRRLGLTQDEVLQFFRRMVFNVMTRNCDDHVKNVSFLMDKSGTWTLAPAYDVTFAYKPGSPWTGLHQMTINGKRDSIEFEDLISCAKAMDIKRSQALQIVEEIEKSLADWKKFAENAGISESRAIEISSYFTTYMH